MAKKIGFKGGKAWPQFPPLWLHKDADQGVPHSQTDIFWTLGMLVDIRPITVFLIIMYLRFYADKVGNALYIRTDILYTLGLFAVI